MKAQALALPYLWPWLKVKVIQTGIMPQNLEVYSIKSSLKQIDSQASRRRPMVENYVEFSPLNINRAKQI